MNPHGSTPQAHRNFLLSSVALKIRYSICGGMSNQGEGENGVLSVFGYLMPGSTKRAHSIKPMDF